MAVNPMNGELALRQPTAPEPEALEWPDTPWMTAGAGGNGADIRPSLSNDPQAWMANAAEELTFQFSETLEAQGHALEQRLEAQREEVLDSPQKIQQVQAVLRLMEGREGYQFLRSQARAFAQAYRENPDQARAMLDLAALTPERRHALLCLAQEAVAMSSGVAHLKGAVQALQSDTAATVRQARDTQSLAQRIFEAPADRPLPTDTYFTLVGTQPTVRTVLDTAVELGAETHVLQALSQMQRDWGQTLPMVGLEQMGGLLMVHRLIQVVRSMMHETGQLMAGFGLIQPEDSARMNRQVRSLLDLAQSTMPSGLIDKLATGWLASARCCPRCSGKSVARCARCEPARRTCTCVGQARPCTCSDSRSFLFGLLHLHARRWPEAVWASPDCKKALLEQLVRKQPASSGPFLPRGVR